MLGKTVRVPRHVELSELGWRRAGPPLTSSFSPKLVQRFGSKETGGAGLQPGMFFVTLPKCILLWAPSKKQLNLSEWHRNALIWRPRSGWYAPARREEPRAASHPRARACRSRFRTGGRPDEQTFRCLE